MCIICNMGTNDASIAHAEQFLRDFETAQKAMGDAAAALHECAKVDRRYDVTHKAMVRLIREWNLLEHSREHGPTHQPEGDI